MPNATPAIDLQNLTVCYGEQSVLTGFNLQVHRGEKVTLTGPSGSGKSTVLKCVLGFVRPEAGSVRVLGSELDGGSVWEARRRMAYVAQEPDLGTGTAREAVEAPFDYKANAGLRGNLDRLPELLERFNLAAPLLGKQLSELSGGEKQRIALVSAILLERPIILLDEASSALDKGNKAAVARYFEETENLTVLSVSHDPEGAGFDSRVVELSEKQEGRSSS